MGVFLGLRHAELFKPVAAHIVTQRVLNKLRRIRDRQGQRLVILGGADVRERIDLLLSGKAVKIGEIERPCHLSCPVGAEVHENDAVAPVDNTLGAADNGLYKLVRHIVCVARLDRVNRVRVHNTLTADDGVVALLHALPALVSIHTVETSLYGGDFGVAKLSALVLKLFYKARAALGGHIAPVKEAVEIHLLHSPVFGHIQYSEDVAQVAVDTAGGKKPHDVELFAVELCVLHGLDIHGVFEKPAVFYLLAHLGQDLEHHAPRADIGVPHLGIAHLTLRQAHVKPGGRQPCAGVGGKKRVEIGGLCLRNGVAGRGRSKAVAVKND